MPLWVACIICKLSHSWHHKAVYDISASIMTSHSALWSDIYRDCSSGMLLIDNIRLLLRYKRKPLKLQINSQYDVTVYHLFWINNFRSAKWIWGHNSISLWIHDHELQVYLKIHLPNSVIRSIQNNQLLHNISYCATIANGQYKSYFQLTKDTPYRNHADELWAVFYHHFGENQWVSARKI